MSIKSADGSLTLFHPLYEESYHNLREGACTETLHKHIYPAYELGHWGEEIRVLDICFGLGYNSFFTLWYFLAQSSAHISVYSPEKEGEILEKLLFWEYPLEIQKIDQIKIKKIIQDLIWHGKSQGERWGLECFIGDAREYLQKFPDGFFDWVYQDAFSPNKNPELWSEDYFKLLYAKLGENGIVTTYSQSSMVRDNAKNAGFYVYEKKQSLTRNSRIFSKKEQSEKNLKQK